MTYIIGLKKFGVTAIICDTKTTRADRRNSGPALKSGILFPGCIYGCAGDVRSIQRFIEHCKVVLDGTDTLMGFWTRFRRIVDLYPFEEQSAFQLILSSRHSGEPQLYCLDSHKKMQEDHLTAVAKDIVSIGSGTKILDDELMRRHNEEASYISNMLVLEEKAPAYTYPYYYCLWLMEHAKGLDASKLEDHGVGGFFHFTVQMHDRECRQESAIYILNNPYKNYSHEGVRGNYIISWGYRIGFLDNGNVLAIQNTDDYIKDFILMKKPEGVEDADQYKLSLSKEFDRLPPYVFCGIGFSDIKHRTLYGIYFNIGEATPYLIDTSKRPWTLDDEIKRHITSHIASIEMV